jgi:hypothetical protein
MERRPMNRFGEPNMEMHKYGVLLSGRIFYPNGILPSSPGLRGTASQGRRYRLMCPIDLIEPAL